MRNLTEMKAIDHERNILPSIQGAVCVVAADQRVRNGLSMVPGALSVKVVTFSTAEELLGRLNGEEPALLITELALPGMSGFDLMRTLDEKGIQLPVIGLTTDLDPGKRGEASQLGFIELIEMPFVYWSVVARVRQALGLPSGSPFF